ncbi:MAG TPA: hypothetical protein VME43_23455 [Bryobacteraceae bacterium]|nr:hypothetical protein [Bryobacteraceae bacterium]
MPIIQRKAQSISIVNGNMPPLSTEQRKLVEIFVWYLRQLPVYKEESSWKSEDYSVLNRLLFRFFKARNPTWTMRKARDGQYSWEVADIPDKADEEWYRELMQHTAISDDPRVARRLKVLEMGRSKRRVLQYVEDYQEERKEIGLPPDPTFSRAVITPLESKAQETWGEDCDV